MFIFEMEIENENFDKKYVHNILFLCSINK